MSISTASTKRFIPRHYISPQKITERHAIACMGVDSAKNYDNVLSEMQKLEMLKQKANSFFSVEIKKIMREEAMERCMLDPVNGNKITRFKDIGKEFAHQLNEKTAKDLFMVCFGVFDLSPGWAFHLEKQFMEKENFKYIPLPVCDSESVRRGAPRGTGLQALIRDKKTDLVKVIMRKATKYHGYYISIRRINDGDVPLKKRHKGVFSEDYVVRHHYDKSSLKLSLPYVKYGKILRRDCSFLLQERDNSSPRTSENNKKAFVEKSRETEILKSSMKKITTKKGSAKISNKEEESSETTSMSTDISTNSSTDESVMSMDSDVVDCDSSVGEKSDSVVFVKQTKKINDACEAFDDVSSTDSSLFQLNDTPLKEQCAIAIRHQEILRENRSVKKVLELKREHEENQKEEKEIAIVEKALLAISNDQKVRIKSHHKILHHFHYIRLTLPLIEANKIW